VDSMPSVPILNKAFRNNGHLKFSDEGINWGFTQPSFSNGAAYGDLDNDGDLDLIVNNVNMPCFVYKNNSREINGNHFISFQLEGKAPNKFAIGAKIEVQIDSATLTRELIPSRGFQSSTDYRIVIGLGNKNATFVKIIWPDRSESYLKDPAVDKHHFIRQPDSSMPTVGPTSILPFLTEPVNHQFEKHIEDTSFVDYYNERNVPVMLSREGPKAVPGDVNKDGWQDIFIGGAKGQAGQLYFQTKNGFIKSNQKTFEADKEFEDIAVLFFDCDKDGDEDLFVGSGGNNLPPRNPYLKHRLYKNDGRGNYKKDEAGFGATNSNIAVAAADDFDGDGDLDLFVGGRSLSYNYGVDPDSYIYENDGKGHFKDVTKQLNSGLGTIGMVTSAIWTDITGDKKNELVIVGEWMTPRIFSFSNGKLNELTTNMSNLFGWWQTAKAADLDGDGDNDLVLGNYGNNFYLHPDEQHPVKLWMNDFDMNTLPDKIFSRTIDGKDVPVFLKREFTDAMPSLKKENLRHRDYAKKTIQTLFKPELIQSATVKTFNYSSSVIAWNEGGGKFTIQQLPLEVQLSSVNAILCKDITKDGKLDIVVGGNITECLPQFGRLDANYGIVLENKGNKQFAVMPAAHTGLSVTGMVRDIAWINGIKENYILFLRNNDDLIMYKLSTHDIAQ
ncbi:MAG TPA: FG-GAP-like repeat-containing protein, partial [Chitinophagaceae bacterium]|nr:FG-GAP-like repeat-containing protein [Chitinophagaceae bacterium]